MPEKRTPPYSPDEVKSFNDYQDSNVFHPYTHSGLDGHKENLIAKEDGLHCPKCDYVQKWGWVWTFNNVWRELKTIRG